MNIVHVLGMRSQKFGGLERFIIAIAKEARASGDILVVMYEELPLNKEYVKCLKDLNVVVVFQSSQRGHILKFCWKFLYICIKFKPKVVHAHFDPAGYLALLISKLIGIKKRIKTLHSMLGESPVHIGRKTRILKKIMYWSCTDVICVSDAVKKEFIETFNVSNKLTTKYIGVDSTKINQDKHREKYGLHGEKFIITCVAFHAPIKGIDILIDIIEILVKEIEFTNFIFVQVGAGDAEYLTKIKQRATEKNLLNYIVWMGLQNNVPEIFSVSDICIQPSRSEGISLALMEASMQGLPLVGSNVGGIPEVVIDNINGFLCTTNNAEDFARKIFKLCDQRDLRLSMGRKSREEAERKFSLDRNVQLLMKKYLE